MADLSWSLLGVLIGGAITLWASRRYYMKASEDLERNTDDLKGLITILADYLYLEGVLTERPDKDEQGYLKQKAVREQLGTLSLTASLGDVQESEREEPGPDPEDASPKDERGGA